MTREQKIIKYAAIALAVLIIASMVTGIVGIIDWIVGIGDSPIGDNQVYTPEGDIKSLKIEINAADFKIVNGDSFRVESNLKHLDVSVRQGRLALSDKSHRNSADYKDAAVLLVIPEDMIFVEADIDIGAGRLTVEKISAELFEMEIGAAETQIGYITVTKAAEIQGGAGKISILDGSIKNLDAQMGVGAFVLCSNLLGESELDLGVGEVNITLFGGRDTYTAELNRALGSITFDGERLESSRTVGAGPNKVEINGGVGSINISFK